MDWEQPNQIENMGGVNFFQFIEIDKILTFPRQISGQIGQILLKPDMEWSHGYSTPGTLEQISNPIEDNHGTIYDVILTGEFPGASAAMMELFRGMINRKYVVLAKNHSGKTKVLGSPDQPLIFSYSEKSGKGASDRPAVNYSFKGKSSTTPYFYYTQIYQLEMAVLENPME